MKPTDSHMLKVVATLLALQQYRGEKSDSALMHSQWAADELAMFFALGEALQGADPSAPREALKTEQWLALLKAAKLLGLFPGEPAGVPDQPWLDKVRQQGGDTGWDTWWHRFSPN